MLTTEGTVRLSLTAFTGNRPLLRLAKWSGPRTPTRYDGKQLSDPSDRAVVTLRVLPLRSEKPWSEEQDACLIRHI